MKKRPVEQILLLGDKAESAKYVRFCQHKASAFEAHLPRLATLNKRLALRNGWAWIKVANGRRKIIIYTEAGEALYEFFTSSGIAGRVLGTPPFDEGVEVYVCGRGSFHKWKSAGSVESEPLVEFACSIGGCSPVDSYSPELSPWPQFQCDDVDGEAYMKTRYYWQNQRLHEHVWWPNNSGDTFVTSASGAAPGYSSAGYFSRANFSAGYILQHMIEDVGYDLRPSLYEYASDEASAHGAPDLPPPQWWRRACVQTVAGRTFFVMNDATGKWHFWEAGLFGGIYVPALNVKTVEPTYPSWAQDGLALWNFNKDGTRAVCCPYEPVPCELTESGDVVRKDIGFGYLRLTPADQAAYPGMFADGHEDSPGLLEVQITIEVDSISGEWTPSVTVVREEEFQDTHRYYVAADYLFADGRLGHPEDTLAVLRFEMWVQNGDYVLPPGGHWPDRAVFYARTAAVIDVWNDEGEGSWIEVARIPLHYDTRVQFGSSGRFFFDYDGDEIDDVSGIGESIAATSLFAADYIGSLWAINLRSLSWAINHQRINNPAVAPYWHFGQDVNAYLDQAYHVQDPGLVVPTWDTTGYVLGEKDKLAAWSALMHEVMSFSPLHSFSCHPKGHWSIAAPQWPPGLEGAWIVDLVNARINGSDDRSRSHRELYNAAFGDARTDDYYLDNVDAPRGTYRTTGVWRDKGR